MRIVRDAPAVRKTSRLALPSVPEFTCARGGRLGRMRVPVWAAEAPLRCRCSLAALRVIALAFGALVAPCAPGFDLEGHRGTRGLAPENTLAAFRRALQIGVSTIETDMAAPRMA